MKHQKRIFLLTIVAVLVIFTIGCSSNVSTDEIADSTLTDSSAANGTAQIADAIMTDSIDANGMPGNTVTSFSGDASVIYTSAKILNAPNNTQIRIVWIYATSGEQFEEITLDSGDISDRYIYSSFEPSALLPAGDYQVEYYIEDRTAPDATVTFTVGEVATGTAAVPDGFATYAQTEGGFSIQYPETWTIVESKENLAVKFNPAEFAVENEEEKINAVVVVALKSYAQDVTIEGMQQTWNDQQASAGYENYKSVSSTIDSVNGFDMAISEYSWSYADGALYTMDFLILNGADLYVITFTATENALETLYPSVEQMVISFNLL
jgi:hypothetical protein